MEVYLSRLILNARDSRVRRDVSDTYQLHRTILSTFPKAPAGVSAREHFGILYRLESLEQEPLLFRLIVQSTTLPNWSALPARIFGPAPDERGNPAVRRVDEEYRRISNGMQLVFRLRANPTRRVRHRSEGSDPLAGKRVALLREEEQLAWLARKGEQHGFRLLTTQYVNIPAVQAAKQANERGYRPVGNDRKSMPLTFGATVFTGKLEVTDAKRFYDALIKGIGSGKGFGFGLLSVASANR